MSMPSEQGENSDRIVRRRLRAPTAKPGELVIRWGKMPRDNPEICYSWGDGCSKRDMYLLHNALACEHPDPQVSPIFSKMLPSLLSELEDRGYDLTTLRFSVRKKVL